MNRSFPVLARRQLLLSLTAVAVALAGCNDAADMGQSTGDPGPAHASTADSLPPLAAAGAGGPYSDIFAPDNIWATPIPDDAEVDPRSPQMIAALAQRVEAQAAAGIGPGLAGRARAAVYVVGPEVERVPVQLDTGSWGDELERALAQGVPIPRDARAAGGVDEGMAIFQPSSDTYWELFLARQALHSPQFEGEATVAASGDLPAGSYAYKVTAVNDRGETNGRAVSLPVTVAGGGHATIRWAPIDGATGYRIYRGTAEGEPGLIATVGPHVTRFTDTGAAAGQQTPPVTNTAVTPGEWRAAYGGVIPNVSRSPGYFRDRTDGADTIGERFSWGASASGLALAGGLVTKRDVESGHVDHALALGLPNLDPATSQIAAGSWAYPAQRSDGKSNLPTAIPEGARLRLDPGLDLDQLDLSPFVRSLAVAAQRYGIYVQDGSAATVMYGEDPTPYMRAGEPNFYDEEIGPRQPGFLADFPWEHLQVLELDLCRDPNRPCRPGGDG